MSLFNISQLSESKSKLTLICHNGDINVKNDSDNIMEISPEHTMAMADSVDDASWLWLKANPDFMRLLRCVFTADRFPSFDSPSLKSEGNGLKHVVGLIILMKSAASKGKRPFVRFPETYLHPAQQTGLADLLVQF